MDEKSRSELLSERLFAKQKHAALIMDEDEIKRADEFCESYKAFLQASKTERKAAAWIKEAAEKAGFTPFDAKKSYKPGDRAYVCNRGKAVILAVFGREGCKNGVSIAAAHIDSPRLDLKPNPLYEDGEQAFFKTHYYGGIKKYQWTATPLSLHGVVIKNDGEKVEICVGEDPGDPKFCVTDLLPHLSAEQYKKTLSEAIKGEDLNILIGSRPFKDDRGGELVKLQIMNLLNEKYGITERDFVSAELEAVPAGPVCDVGFDRSMIGAYGQDDRVCAYTAALAAFDCQAPRRTAVVILADKEEVGSDGNTGMNSSFFQYFIEDIAAAEGVPARDVLRRSECISADVAAGHDPNYPDVLEKNNAAYLNRGVVVQKYTGSRGKAETSDAGAEFVGKIRRLFDGGGIIWQTGELGKVDLGGGGTVAKYIARLDVDTVDAGVPVLSMHSPFEVVSKLDVYMAYKAFLAFFKN